MIKRVGVTKIKLSAIPVWLAAYCCLFFIIRSASTFLRRGDAYLDDDAYYYVIIAKNILRDHMSTFDGQTFTNGYQPLWMGSLLAQYALAGDSVYITLMIQIFFMSLALYLLLSALDCTNFVSYAIFTTVFIGSMTQIIGNGGMETPLWAACFASLVYVAKRTDLNQARNAILLGLLAALCVAARIDSVVFVVPFAFLVLPTPKARLLAISTMSILGLAYAGWNQSMFGIPFPISGAIKSLGGFQLNNTLIEQLVQFDSANPLWLPKLLLSAPWVMVILWIASFFLIWHSPRGSLTRCLLVAYTLGLVAYALKLILFSSWIIWDWYNFPILIGTTATLYAALPLLSRQLGRMSTGLRRGTAITLAALLIIAPVALYTSHALKPQTGDYIAISKLAVAKFAPVLKDQPVAMGDRAGSFAFVYGGPVTQLEGLVNDKEYYQLVRSGGDVKPLLCQRGVKYLLSFSVDLGDDYSDHEIEIFRRSLTQFAGPTLHVSSNQQVGKVFDLTKFDNRSFDEGDSYLYIWDLSCPKAR